MEIVAITCMIIIIIVGTHLHNWGSRAMFNDDKGADVVAAWFFVSAVYAAIVYHAFKYLILWAYPLIK